MRRMAASDPELAARMILHSMPAAAADLPEGLSYRLELDGLGAWRVIARGDRAEVIETQRRRRAERRRLRDPDRPADPGEARRRRQPALRARRAGACGSAASAARRWRCAASPTRPARATWRSSASRSIPTSSSGRSPTRSSRSGPRGTASRSATTLIGEGGGALDHRRRRRRGRHRRAALDPEAPTPSSGCATRTGCALLSGELQPTDALRLGMTEIEGAIPPVTLLGRWIDRAEGVDGPELEREARAGAVQARRAGTWGSKAADERRPGERQAAPGGLMDYQQLYALWERQNWRASELDFSRRQGAVAADARASPSSTRSTASAASTSARSASPPTSRPFLLAAPSGEIEAFLATQLVDEMRHAVFFDRFMAEVMALDGEDLRARLQRGRGARCSDPGASSSTTACATSPTASRRSPTTSSSSSRASSPTTWSPRECWRCPASGSSSSTPRTTTSIPGFNKGFRLVEQDEHRHIAFGVRFLKDVCEDRPEMKKVVVDRLCELLPRSAEVFCPPQDDDPVDFVSYGTTSAQIYGFAYQALDAPDEDDRGRDPRPRGPDARPGRLHRRSTSAATWRRTATAPSALPAPA